VEPQAEIGKGADTLISHLHRFNANSEEELAEAMRYYSPYFERVTGRPLKGLLYAKRYWVKATDCTQPLAQAEFGYYLLSEIPKSYYAPIYQKRWQSQARKRNRLESQLAQKKAAEKEEHQRQLAEAERQELLKPFAPFMNVMKLLVGPIVISLVMMGLFGGGLYLLLQPSKTLRRYFGILAALVGLIGFLSVVAVLSYSYPTESRIETSVGTLMIYSVIFFFAEMVAIGSADIATHKGYPMIVGLALGLVLSLLGMIVVILLPQRQTQQRVSG
jgi:hypothetical protein